MYRFQRVKIIKFFVFNVVFLLTLLPFLVRGNELHEIIKECEKGFNEGRFSDLIKADLTKGENDSKLTLEVDKNGFLPIDLLIFEIKRRKNDKGGKALIQAFGELFKAMVTQNDKLYTSGINKLHTKGIKILQAVGTSKPEEYNLSPLGFLLSPINVEGYTLGKDRTLQANNQSKRDKKGLSNFEQEAFKRLWEHKTIKNKIEWKGVISVDTSDSDKGKLIQSTPLHIAIKYNHNQLMKAILGDDVSKDKGEYLNVFDGDGYTPLMRAFYLAGGSAGVQEKAFEELLNYKEAQLDERCKASDGPFAGQTLLEMAVSCGFTAGVKALLQKGANVNTPGNSSGMNLFHRAANSTHGNAVVYAIVHVVLEKTIVGVGRTRDFVPKYPHLGQFAKTAMIQKDSQGNAPLYYLLNSGNADEKLYKEFLGYGADLNSINNKGQTLVHLLFNDLLLNKPDGQENIKKFFTLFEKHAASKKIDFVRLLNTRDADGKTVVDLLAGMQNGAALLEMVKKSGGKPASQVSAPEELTNENQLGEKQNQTPPASTHVPLVTPVEQPKGTQQDPTLPEKRDGTAQKAPQEPKKSGNPVGISENNTPNSANNNILSNPLVQGTIATAVVLSLFLIGRKFFNKEGKVEEVSVGHGRLESVF